jgi:hypothetical protein
MPLQNQWRHCNTGAAKGQDCTDFLASSHELACLYGLNAGPRGARKMSTVVLD